MTALFSPPSGEGHRKLLPVLPRKRKAKRGPVAAAGEGEPETGRGENLSLLSLSPRKPTLMLSGKVSEQGRTNLLFHHLKASCGVVQSVIFNFVVSPKQKFNPFLRRHKPK